MLVPALLFGGMVYQDPSRETGFRPASSGWFYAVAALIVLAAIPLVQVLAAWNQHLHIPGGLDKSLRDAEKSANDAIEQVLQMPNTFSLFLNLVVMALVPAICEEAFFRGVIQKMLIRATRNTTAGVLLGALLFSAMHFQFLEFFSRALLGIILGYLFVFSGSLWPSILAHFVYNGSQVLYFYLQQHQDAAHPSAFFANNLNIPISLAALSTFLVISGLLWMKRIKPTTWP